MVCIYVRSDSMYAFVNLKVYDVIRVVKLKLIKILLLRIFVGSKECYLISIRASVLFHSLMGYSIQVN